MSVITPLEIIRKRLSVSEVPRHGGGPALENFPEVDEEVSKILRRIFPSSEEFEKEIEKLRLHGFAPGTVVRVESFMHPHLGGERAELVYPANLLLDERVGGLNGIGIWRAWMVSRDIHYATHFDLMRAGDPNFCEEGCAVIQCWNPVLIYEPCIHEAVGRVGEEKLGAARKLASDFASSVIPKETEVGRFGKPGDLIYRQINGVWQQTGCWLDRRSLDDVRNEYVNLYREFARSVTSPVERALAASEQKAASSHSNWVMDAGDGWGARLTAAAKRAAALFVPWAATSASAFRLESADGAYMHAAGSSVERFNITRGEFVEAEVDYENRDVKVNSCFFPEGKRYKLFFLTDNNEVIAHVPRERDGYLSVGPFDGNFEEHCPEIFEGLRMEIRELSDGTERKSSNEGDSNS